MSGMNGNMQPPHQHRHIWIITGPAGCGKTTVAQYLAKELSLPYIEGDDVSSSAHHVTPHSSIAASCSLGTTS